MHKSSGLRDPAASFPLPGARNDIADRRQANRAVAVSAVVFLGFRLSRRPPTERYPYGLERAEDLAGIGIAVVIWASAAFAGYESIRKLRSPRPWPRRFPRPAASPGPPALAPPDTSAAPQDVQPGHDGSGGHH